MCPARHCARTVHSNRWLEKKKKALVQEESGRPFLHPAPSDSSRGGPGKVVHRAEGEGLAVSLVGWLGGNQKN